MRRFCLKTALLALLGGCGDLVGVPVDASRERLDAARAPLDAETTDAPTRDAPVDARGDDVRVNVPVGADLQGAPDRAERHVWPVSVTAMSAVADGRGHFLVAAGVADGFARDFSVARFDADFRPAPLPGAAPDDFARFPMDHLGVRAAAIPRAITLDPDGRAVLAGTAMSNNLRAAAALRLLDDGALDASFGSRGVSILDRFADGRGTEATWRHALADRDGVLLVGSDRIPYSVGTVGQFVRLDASGVATPPGLRSDPRFLALSVALPDPEGYVLVGELAADTAPALLFLDRAGNPRPLGDRGLVRHDARTLGGMHPRAARRDARGGIVVAGAAAGTFETGYLRVVRFDADGTPDLTFGEGGFVRGPRGAVWNRSETLQAGMIPWGADSFLLATQEGIGASVLRLRGDRFDPSFGEGGTARLTFSDFQYVFALLPAADGGAWVLARSATEREVRAAHFAPR